jgi:DNA-binding NarL/FixJ family response regulator
MKKLRIIIADDHSMIRQGVKAVIQSQKNWEFCGEADNGRSALELVRNKKPDIAILDISMPGLNGLDTTRILQSEHLQTKVLILTMHDSESTADEVHQAGASGYLLKSDAGELLSEAVETLAAGGRFITPQFSSSANGLQQRAAPVNGEGFRFRLTPREREIVQLLAEGKINKDVAVALNISVNTVETHRKNILGKLNLRNTADLVRYAIRNNLVIP